MADDTTPPNPPNQPPNQPPSNSDNSDTVSEARIAQLSARVPEGVAKGSFSTGAIVLAGAGEVTIDFVARLTQPHQIVARVILPLNAVPTVLATLRDNVDKFTKRFGAIPEMPKPNIERRPSLQEIYDDLRLPDAMLSGSYANGLIIGHTPAEFCLDFIANLFPRSAVSARIYLSAPHVPRLIDSLSNTYDQHIKRIAARQQPKPPAASQDSSSNNPAPPDEPAPGDKA